MDPLMLGVTMGQNSFITELLKRSDVDVNGQNIAGQTALMLAAKHGKPETLNILLNMDEVNINLKDHTGGAFI